MKTLLREPLLHFFALGVVVFALYGLFDETPAPAPPTILVTTDDANRLAAQFEATWRRPPVADELDRLIDQFVREEVYVREATTLGLDQGDAVVRQRLRLKMEFLTEAGAQGVDPDDETLAAHIAENPERFERPPLVAFEQVLLNDAVDTAAIPAIEASLNAGRDPGSAARPSLLPQAIPLSPPRVVDSTFGTGFFRAVSDLPLGEWGGPVTSGLGRHLVRVTERSDGGLPDLAEIRERAVQDYRSALAARLREERFEAMRSRYVVTRPDAAEVLGE